VDAIDRRAAPITVENACAENALHARAVTFALAAYARVGASWIFAFTWQGLWPPNAIASTDRWLQATVWPLHVDQAPLGLRFL
jgi:hypothetical protein